MLSLWCCYSTNPLVRILLIVVRLLLQCPHPPFLYMVGLPEDCMSLLANASTLKTLLVWGPGEEGKCVAGCIAGTQAYCWCRLLQASAYSKWKQAEAQPLWKPGLEQPCFSLRNPACWPVILEPVWKGRLVNETSIATTRTVLFPSHLYWQTLRPLLACNFFLGSTQIIWYLSFVLFLWERH